MSTRPRPHPGFRPDIQGMRALAVVLVVLAHAGFRTASGGFVGVDVFFVISGFLITSLLLREATREGRISLLDFYARRARRILPAAVVVLAATVVASAVVLPLVRVPEIAKDSIWAVLFAANIRFATVGTDYFAQGEATSPLQHYWSLAVEEQFYLVWPLLMIGWLALAGSRGREPRMRTLATGLGLLCAASFVWSLVATHGSPVTAYFSTLTRAWELGAGALVAVLLHRRAGRVAAAPRGVLEGAGWVGLAMVLAAVLLYDDSTPFPGYAAALPVLGTVLLLASGAGERTTGVGRLLSVRPARVLGDWSYSLYLWHWPVLRLFEDRLGEGRLPLPVLALALALVVALSAATYRWVEQPFRTARTWVRPARGVALYPLSVVLVLAVALGGRAWVDEQLGGGDNPAITTAQFAGEDLSKDPQVALVQASVLAARAGQEVPSDLTPPLLGIRKATAPLGDCDYRTGTTELCPVGDPDADRTMVLLGDSHARAWSPAFEELGRTEGYAVHHLVYSGCSATTAVQADRETERAVGECEDFKEWALETIEEMRPDVVAVVTSAVSPVLAPSGDLVGISSDTEEFLEVVTAGYAEELEALQGLAGQVVAVGGTPKLPREPGVCLSAGGGVDLGDCLFEPGTLLERVQQGYAEAAAALGVPYVDAQRWFCWDGSCPAVVGGTITMRDSEHVTPDYARQLAGPLAKRLPLER